MDQNCAPVRPADHPTVTRAMKNAGFTVLLASGLRGTDALLTEPVLHALNVPPVFGADARLYYILYLIAYLPSALAALFITIVNGIGSSRRIFWINIIVICANLLAAVLLLAVFRHEADRCSPEQRVGRGAASAGLLVPVPQGKAISARENASDRTGCRPPRSCATVCRSRCKTFSVPPDT